jgi:hypothetical protein
MVIKYVVYENTDYEFTKKSAYCIVQFHIGKNLLTFGSKVGNTQFVLEVVEAFFSEDMYETDPDYRYKGFVRFNYGQNLREFMSRLDRLKNLQIYIIDKIQKIERMM